MFGLGWSEIFLIVLVGLLVIGPDKLPEVARGLAKTIRGVQRLAAEVRYSINLDELQANHAPRPTPPPGTPPHGDVTPLPVEEETSGVQTSPSAGSPPSVGGPSSSA